MSRLHFARRPWQVAIVAVGVILACASTFAAGRRGMSIDDMLKAEGLGAAVFEPSGSQVIYERLRPYDALGDYSFRTYATMGKTGHQLWRYDLLTGEDARLLPGLDQTASTYLLSLSPGGKQLAIMQYRFGALSLGTYDLAREREVLFEATPAFGRTGEHNPVFVSDTELVFAALPPGELPDLTSIRVRTGRTLAMAWEDAWRGDVVTASEVRTLPEDQSDQQEAGRLLRADTLTGEIKLLAEGLYADLRVSPDRRYLAALAVSRPRPVGPDRPVEADPRHHHLTVFDLTTGEARLFAAQFDLFPYTIAWAPDSRRVAVYGWEHGKGPREGRFVMIDVQTGALLRYEHIGLDLVTERERGFLARPERAVVTGAGIAVFARAIPPDQPQTPRLTYQPVRPVGLAKPDWYLLQPDGTSRNLTGGIAGVSGVPLHGGGNHLTVAADDGVYQLSADGARRLTPSLPGQFRAVSAGTFATRAGLIRPEFSDEGLFAVTWQGQTKMVMVDLRPEHAGNTATVEAPSSATTPLAGSLAAGAVLFRAEDGARTSLLLARAQQDRKPMEIAHLNARMGDVDPGSWKLVSYPVSAGDKWRGRTIESCVLLPPGYDSGKPPPLIVEVYPDAHATCAKGGAMIAYPPDPHSPYLWAGLGYAYARLSLPADLIRTPDGPIAGMQGVVEAGIDALVARSLADPRRIALVGASQGGVSALYVAARSSRFRAVIAMNSWADLFGHYFGGNGVYSYVSGKSFGSFARYDISAGSAFGIGATPFDDPETYYRNSPVFLAADIDAPALLVHSDMDEFSMSQFDEMYGALLRQGKDVRYVRYWGEGHTPSSPANLRDLWMRMDLFLAEHGMRSNAEVQPNP